MAFVETRFPVPDSSLRVWINLNEAVGAGAPNLPNDVLVVQIFLNAILNAGGTYPVAIPRNGLFDGPTEHGIRDFQRRWRRMVRSAYGARDGAIDGRVSAARNLGYDRGTSVWSYTIVDMNIEFQLFDPSGFAALLAANGYTAAGPVGATAPAGATT